MMVEQLFYHMLKQLISDQRVWVYLMQAMYFFITLHHD